MTGVSVDDVRDFAKDFPRSYEVVVRGRLKFRVGQIVWLAFSREDERLMEFAFPKEERRLLVETDPERFMFPRATDMRFNWIRTRLDLLTREEMEEFVFDAWRMVVPKKVAAEYLARHS